MATDSTAPAADVAKQYNLLPSLIPHLDRHLVFPLLNFLEDEVPEDEDASEFTQLKYNLLQNTNMSDFVGDLYAQLNNLSERPAEYSAKRDEVLEKRRVFEQETEKIQNLLSDAEVVGNLRSDKASNMTFLKDNHGVTPAMVDQLYEFGQFQYSCGDYGSASELLYQFRILSTDNDKVNAATWGKLASDILTTNWESAMEEVTKLKESIDTRLFSNPLAQLEHRTWLLHWALFPFFNHEPAREALHRALFQPPLHQHHPDFMPVDSAISQRRGHHKPQPTQWQGWIRLRQLPEAIEGPGPRCTPGAVRVLRPRNRLRQGSVRRLRLRRCSPASRRGRQDPQLRLFPRRHLRRFPRRCPPSHL